MAKAENVSDPVRSLKDVFPGVKAPNHVKVRVHRDGDAFPVAIDEGFRFLPKPLKVCQFWLQARPWRGLLLTGPTGSGKTALIEQVSARTGWPLFSVACHGELEFQELIGRIVLNKDGSTGWVDGPAIQAAKAGGILLLDEMNFLRPSVVGGLNALLDARRYTIPETGEEIAIHPDFRIAATANAVAGDQGTSYRGTQKQNIALLDRFIGLEMGYMQEGEEIEVLKTRVSDLTAGVAKVMVTFANSLRSMNAEGRIPETLSLRVLCAWASFVVAYGGSDEAEQAKAITPSLDHALLFRCGAESKPVIAQALHEVVQRHYPQAAG